MDRRACVCVCVQEKGKRADIKNGLGGNYGESPLGRTDGRTNNKCGRKLESMERYRVQVREDILLEDIETKAKSLSA